MRKLLAWIKNTYNNPPLYVTENGVSDCGDINDEDRIHYYKFYINEMLKGWVFTVCHQHVQNKPVRYRIISSLSLG